MPDFLRLLLIALFCAAVVLYVWRHFHHRSFWLVAGYPLTAISVRASWRKVALGCGLTKKRAR